MSRVIINRTKKKAFVASSKIVTIQGDRLDFYKCTDSALKVYLNLKSLSEAERKILEEEIVRRKTLRESSW